MRFLGEGDRTVKESIRETVGPVCVVLAKKPVFVITGEGVERLDEDEIMDYIRGWEMERPLMSVRVVRRERGRVEVEVDYYPVL